MRNLVKYCAVVALLLFVPALAQADSQCTTTELDLMCPNGQILQGINSDGTKLCVDDMSCPPGEILQEINASGHRICVKTARGSVSGTRIASAQVTAYRWPHANVQCSNDEVAVGGGGGCITANGGYTWLTHSMPSSNGWEVRCDTTKNWDAVANVYAVCVKKYDETTRRIQ